MAGGEPQQAEAAAGGLAPIACRILMTILWAGRTTRFDLLKAVNHLAKFVSKWTPDKIAA